MTLDDEDIERIAARVAELLEADTTTRYVDATVVARKLDVDRDWVYAHARELGGVRLGGPRGRLRFDLPAIRRRLECQGQPRPVESAAPSPENALRNGWKTLICCPIQSYHSPAK